MKRLPVILLSIVVFTCSCRKEETIPVSGTATIDNILSYNALSQAYYAFGFLFSEAEKVSTLSTPKPDITVDSDGTNLFLQANNYKNSFYKYGEYGSEALAKDAFDKLTEAAVTQWVAMASSLKAHQVWIYRSGSEHYAKLRIISTVSEVRDNRDYGECTFEWVYQPDGSLAFPDK